MPWRDELLKLANRYYDEAHVLEKRAVEREVNDARSTSATVMWAQADCYHEIYSELCSLVSRLDPRPGAPEGPAKPW
jgi:hypothetical protein